MTKPQQIRVYVRYLGIFRLMSGRKEDVFEFEVSVSLSEVLNEMQKLLPVSLFRQLGSQTLLLSSEPNKPGKVLDKNKANEIALEDGSCITVVTPVTGG